MLLPPPQRERPYTVAEVNAGIAARIESGNTLVWVEGEVAGFKRASSGHCYFRLMDSQSQIPCVMWSSAAIRNRLPVEDGMQVALIASVRTYAKGGYYQLDTQRISEAGAGALAAALEKLKAKLAKEGLFDPARKKPLPDTVKTLGVVTALTGAAIRDIIKVAYLRDPSIDIVIADVPVQGEKSPAAIADAIERMNRQKSVDVLIVGRGGGSADDLWAFNDERVVRAVAASEIPVIAAVGHEIDVTLIDFAADVRAATPSAAAEIAVADTAEVSRRAAALAGRFGAAFRRVYTDQKNRVSDLKRSPALIRPARMVMEARQSLDTAESSISNALSEKMALSRNALAQSAARLNGVSPLAVLARGYAVVSRADGTAVKDSAQLIPHEPIYIRFKKGAITAEVQQVL